MPTSVLLQGVDCACCMSPAAAAAAAYYTAAISQQHTIDMMRLKPVLLGCHRLGQRSTTQLGSTLMAQVCCHSCTLLVTVCRLLKVMLGCRPTKQQQQQQQQ